MKSSNFLSPWLHWRSELPVRFSDQRSAENHEYLLNTIGYKWLSRGTTSPGRNNHPLMRRWASRSADSFLGLNTLAEDLRVLEGIEGIHAVLEDLKNSQRSKAAAHVLHSAALFARSQRGSLAHFFPQSADALPDYLLRIGGQKVAVEAKILLRSDVEDTFTTYAARLSNLVLKEVFLRKPVSPEVYVIVKNPESLPPQVDVLKALLQGIELFNDAPIELRSATTNIFLGPPQDGFEVFQSCHILSPRSPRENIRVMSRGKKASDQLRSESTQGLPGVFYLELNDYQDPHELRDMFARRFDDGHFQGIAGVMLSRTVMHPGPPIATPLDLLASIRNPRSASPIPPETYLQVVGTGGSLFEATKPSATVPAYAHHVVQAKVPPEPTNVTLRMRPIRGLSASMLT